MVHMILLIEHAADRRASIAHVLRRQGYVVLAVGDGALALEMAADNSISLVILDLSNLPSDGSKLYLRFRTSVKTAHVPILLLASNDAEGVQINEHGRCPDNILRHPFLWEELLACVQTQLRVAKRPRAKMLVIEQDTSIQDTLALALLPFLCVSAPGPSCET